MSKTNSRFKMAALAASIALGIGGTAAMAATPTTTQLPGHGKVAVGTAPTVDFTTTPGTMTIGLASTTVIDWGKGAGAESVTGNINSSGVAGFNVGSGATVSFTGASPVLNIDSTGSASQIMGAVTGVGSVFIANSNGIIVGSEASISSAAGVGLIANTRGGGTFDGTAVPTSIEYQGSGGDVTVAEGAALSGASVLVSGGGNVTVDLSAFTAGAVTIQAGVKNSTSALVHDNTDAVLNATGILDPFGPTIAAFSSAGDASTSGALILGANARVDGTLTNTGNLTLNTGFNIAGGLVNAKAMAQIADAAMGSLVNHGSYAGYGHALATTDGGISNAAEMTDIGAVTIDGGNFVNNGAFSSVGGFDVNHGGNVTNKGEAAIDGDLTINHGGDYTNGGTMSVNGHIRAVNGSIANGGELTVDNFLETASDITAGMGFTAGADYSITNTGSIISATDLALAANTTHVGADKNDSTGSFNNTGKLYLAPTGVFAAAAWDDVTLGGSLLTGAGTTAKAVSAKNPLAGTIDLTAGGVLTVATPIATASPGLAMELTGSQVKIMADSTATAGAVFVVAGDKLDDDYAVRVANGVTLFSGVVVAVNGSTGTGGDLHPNVILQGSIDAAAIHFGNAVPVSDVFAGPAGGLVIEGASSYVQFDFTGRIKSAPYTNADNFRYNYLPISYGDTATSTLRFYLRPVAYATNGTSNGLSAVNVLVNGPVDVRQIFASDSVGAGGTAVSGVSNIPNTHLVLQSTGNIAMPDNFYWPGYVYLGNISADADGNALPGTLGLGTISIFNKFSNVLPGDVAGASGIHFITQFPLHVGGDVVTNANAWINFGTDLLTQGYANGALGGSFFGGVNTVGTVVSYGELDPSMFHTHAPTAAK